ncbi:MAG TPA: hypothetical protein VFQ27_00740 [Xanthobacteraceae bacterium]|nr:hypothetical protein [Xanthobacteraceae bacterium]
MKLNSRQVERTLSQFEARAIPEDHPVVSQLADLFGDHTFFLDVRGLNIVEPTDDSGAESAQVINIARWTDANRTSLIPQEPEPTAVVISLALD